MRTTGIDLELQASVADADTRFTYGSSKGTTTGRDVAGSAL